MTKRDGDKLREMQAQLKEIADGYDYRSDTSTSVCSVVYAMECALRGRAFAVTAVKRRLP